MVFHMFSLKKDINFIVFLCAHDSVQVVSEIGDVVRSRRKAGRHSGVVLISRQFIETLPETGMCREEFLKHF